MKSYDTAWTLFHKIREALRKRDKIYTLHTIIELDGAVFGKRHTGNQTEALVAIETKDWVDQKGRRKTKAGFSKVLVAKETKEEDAQKFVDKAIEKNSMVNTEANPSFIHLEDVGVDYQVVGSSQEVLDHWLP